MGFAVDVPFVAVVVVVQKVRRFAIWGGVGAVVDVTVVAVVVAASVDVVVKKASLFIIWGLLLKLPLRCCFCCCC